MLKLRDIPRKKKMCSRPRSFPAEVNGGETVSLGALQGMLAAVPIIANLPQREREAAYEMFSTEKFAPGQVRTKKRQAPPWLLPH